MLGAPRTVALFGRFKLLPRADIVRLLHQTGAREVKDLTRDTSLLAIGSGAANLIASALPGRLEQAAARGIPVVAEARLLEMLRDEPQAPATLDANGIAQIAPDLTALLNAFDIIRMDDGKLRFEDADKLRMAAALAEEDADEAQIVSALRQRRTAPKGRHRLKLDRSGAPVLIWEDGLTTVAGQGLLPLEDGEDLETLFDDAVDAEAEGNFAQAAQLYETCATHDPRDPIAPFNLGNVYLQQQQYGAGKLAYQRAIARRPGFAEAHFNLAICEEAQHNVSGAIASLRCAIQHDPDYGEAMFNLAQLELGQRNYAEAGRLFQTFLGVADSANPLATKAKQALHIIENER